MKTEHNSPQTVKKMPLDDRMAIIQQSLGQQVLVRYNNLEYPKGILQIISFNGTAKVGLEDGRERAVQVEDITLLKKPLGRISDEDLYKIAKIEGFKMPQITTIARNSENNLVDINFHDSLLSIVLLNNELLICNNVNDARPVSFHSFQQLQEWGYALPYKQWSVEQLEEFGIYKLITE